MEYKIKDVKMQHMHGVAEYMYNRAEYYELNKDKMYILGLLHDVGCVYGHEHHSHMGAVMVSAAFSPFCHDIKHCIENHGQDPEFIDVMTRELYLLNEADMQIDHEGKVCSYTDRLTSIELRYGHDSQEYVLALKNICFLRDHSVEEFPKDLAEACDA